MSFISSQFLFCGFFFTPKRLLFVSFISWFILFDAIREAFYNVIINKNIIFFIYTSAFLCCNLLGECIILL